MDYLVVYDIIFFSFISVYFWRIHMSNEVAQRKTFENLKIDLLTKKVFNKLEWEISKYAQSSQKQINKLVKKINSCKYCIWKP